ncbi:MAG: hypothetical protein QOE41_2114 [Mycobacterium sp.]|jgi:hypothetical protein|nr:hypothetical protein [Mycobacterium sp.]MDT5132803.1 hypothetical protein [Mycobacterium sp.]
MSTDPAQIRADVEALLSELPDIAAADAALDIDAIATRLEAAHDVLVRALESVEKG